MFARLVIIALCSKASDRTRHTLKDTIGNNATNLGLVITYCLRGSFTSVLPSICCEIETEGRHDQDHYDELREPEFALWLLFERLDGNGVRRVHLARCLGDDDLFR